jgi:biopolymer transport protein ExbD
VEGPFGVTRHRRRPTINITSLIDVMFLLLIFFMVSSTFKQDAAIDITLPQAESATQQELTSHEITVDAEGQAYLSGQPVNEEQLRTELHAILEADPEAPLVLRADDGADFGKVLRVIDIARSLEASNLVIPTVPLQKSDEP